MKQQLALLASSLLLAGCATASVAQQRGDTASQADLESQVGEAPTKNSPPTGQQWLYGSAESEVAAQQTYSRLTSYLRNLRSIHNKISGPGTVIRSVILEDGQKKGSIKFKQCPSHKLAVVFDADETLIWNVGVMRYMAEQGKDFDPKIWDKWERSGAGKAVAIPGAAKALKEIRALGITVVANTNRSAANAKGTEDTLRAAGLGEFKHGETLFLRGDTPGGSDKDGRRAIIAKRYCVVAMAGDQLGDFSHAFNAKGLRPKDRKALLQNSGIADMWGQGWFLFPNPIYGPSIAGDFDEIYSPETSWSPEAAND